MSHSTGGRWTRSHAERLEALLGSTSVEDLTRLLWRLRRRLRVDAPPLGVLRTARELEFVAPARDSALRITALGAKVSDSLCEYVYWKERGRRHHSSREIGALHPERLRGKRILEVGCGAGVNLLSLQRCAEVVGVDVEPLYLQVAASLARVEGVRAPPRVSGRAECLPFADGAFDVALFHGSLPYMRIERALRESARVLRPGGRMIAIVSDLHQTVRDRVRARSWTLFAPSVFLREARGLAGMLAYPWVGRLGLKPFDPVHTTRARTRRWILEAGLVLNERESCMRPGDVCYVADKPAVRDAPGPEPAVEVR